VQIPLLLRVAAPPTGMPLLLPPSLLLALVDAKRSGSPTRDFLRLLPLLLMMVADAHCRGAPPRALALPLE
jgi:hypothetical protein